MAESDPVNEPKVLLTTVSVRKSARTGKSWLPGWLGRSRLIGFQGEDDRYGNPTFFFLIIHVTHPAMMTQVRMGCCPRAGGGRRSVRVSSW